MTLRYQIIKILYSICRDLNIDLKKIIECPFKKNKKNREKYGMGDQEDNQTEDQV